MSKATAKKNGFWATIWEYMTTVDHKKIAILFNCWWILLRTRWYRSNADSYSACSAE